MVASKSDLTVRRISERTHVQPETVRQWIRKGLLPSRKIGPAGTHRVTPQALEAFLDRH